MSSRGRVRRGCGGGGGGVVRDLIICSEGEEIVESRLVLGV
jgi:hypothetical protein